MDVHNRGGGFQFRNVMCLGFATVMRCKLSKQTGETQLKAGDVQIKGYVRPWTGHSELERSHTEQKKIDLHSVLDGFELKFKGCLLYTSPSPRDFCRSRMPSSA